jgi:hypothetical protein
VKLLPFNCDGELTLKLKTDLFMPNSGAFPLSMEETVKSNAQYFADRYIQKHHPYLQKVCEYASNVNNLAQIWQFLEESGLPRWIFFTLILSDQPQYPSSLEGEELLGKENRAYLEQTIDEMLLSDHLPHHSLSLNLSEALEGDRLSYYCLTIHLQADFSVETPGQIEIDLHPSTNLEPPTPPVDENTPPDPPKHLLSDEPEPHPLSELAQTTSLSPFNPCQRAHELTQQLSPPSFPIASKLNPALTNSFQIKVVKDRYGISTNLLLEYRPNVTEFELIEQFHRLSHYQALKHLIHLHCFVQIQMQHWHKQNGQPSAGALAPDLCQHINQLSDYLSQRLDALTESQLSTVATPALQAECALLSTEQQQQKTLLAQIEQNPLLGYLDPYTSEQTPPLQTYAFLSDPARPIDIVAPYLKNKDNNPSLSHVESCRSDKYQTYQKRNPERSGPSCFIEYAITQKLHSNNPVSIGPAFKAVYPRLELLWGHADEPSMPLTQIWRIYPMLRNDPVQWLLIAATTDTQRLKTIALENGQVAQEGSSEYLGRSLQLMAQNLDEYTQMLAGLVTEAVEQKRVKYLHFHQTQDLQTGEPRDIVKLQFQLDR